MSIFVNAQAYKGKGKVKGVIKDEENNPIPNVSIKLYHVKSASSFDTTSDEQGYWYAYWIRGGLWYIDFNKEGYLPKRISVTLAETSTNPDIEIVMKKIKGKIIPKEVIEKLDKGNQLYDAKKYDEAIAEYQKILELYPDIYLINENIANCYFNKGDYQKAIEFYQKVLDKEPENANALLGIGNSYSQTDPSKAIEYYNKIDLEEIQDPVVLYNMATFYYNEKDYQKALQLYEASVKIKADFTDSLYQIGVTYIALGDYPKALQAFETFLQYDSTSEKAAQVKDFINFLKSENK
jgi:tetratricopeptide (TPR) repeat protein